MKRRAFAALLVATNALASVGACTAFQADEAPSPSSEAGSESSTATDGSNNDSLSPSADGGVDADAPVDAAADADALAPGCPIGLGPTMVVVGVVPNQNRTLCIDRTEVTSTQYAAFRASVGDLGPLKPLVPQKCAVLSVVALSPANNNGELPQVNVSFCSAAYYCAAQGKRLCGSLEDGGAVVRVQSAVPDPPMEWDFACANGLSGDYYPWGTIDPKPAIAAGCQTKSLDASVDASRAVGAAPNCGPGAGSGPLDMIGNVWEWVNLRRDQDAGTASYTGERGGAFTGQTVGSGCKSGTGKDAPLGEYAVGAADIGFRCCADKP